MIVSETPRQQMTARLAAMRSDFASWKPHLVDLYQHLDPRRARWTLSDFNKGDRQNGTIINNTPTLAVRTFAAGFMAAVSNPLLQWFRLTPPDPEVGELGSVKSYLHVAQERLRWAFMMGNFYQGLADVYRDLAVAGFSAAMLEEDPRRILRLTVWPMGEYHLAANAQGDIDSTCREVPMTVRQLVGEFCIREGNLQAPLDFSHVSNRVKTLWEHGQYSVVVKVIHGIQPNRELDLGTMGPRGMPFSSLWIEEGSEDNDKLLRVGGFNEFPVLCPRWSVRGNETYGRSEAMGILGDCKQLQHHERRLATLIDLTAKPPMIADEQMRGSRLGLVPGDTLYAPRGQVESYKPALQVNPAAIVALLEHIQRAERRIDRGMFSDILSRVLNDDRAQRATATEIEQLSREVASQVGPGLLRMDGDLYRPAIDRSYNMLERRGFLPAPPQELQGVDIKPEFISPMHQAAKGVELQPIRIFLGEVSALAKVVGQGILDKLAGDKIVTELANVTGVKPDLVLADDEVAKLRQTRAAREQALQQGQAMLAAAKGAKDLGTTPAPAPDNALGSVISALSPGQATGAIQAPFGVPVGAVA